MDQLVVLQEIFESYMRGGFSRPIDPKSISGDCADLVAALLESFEDGQIDEDICVRLMNCLSDIYDIKRLGDICRLAGHLGIAARCYNKALSITGDPHVRSVLLNNLGQVHARQGYLGRALHYYERAEEGFSTLGDVGSLAQVLGNMGSSYRTSREYDKAIDSCRKSLEIFRSLDDDFGVAQMTGSLGRVYAETGEYDLALQHYEKSLADFEGLGDQRQVAWLLNRMGRVNAELKRWEEAIGYYHKSMEIFEGIGQEHNAGVVLSNLGRLYMEKGDISEAADHLETSLDLIRKRMQPVRANAVSWLAAARSMEGHDLHQQALRQIAGEKEDSSSAADLLHEASVSYRGAAECYAEVARTEGVGLPGLVTEEGIARFASAFVILEMETDAQKGVKLAEEGIAALNCALSTSEDGPQTPSVEALRRSMMGMKETWRLTLTKDEPWKLNDVVSDATEHFTQAILQIGSASRSSKEACGHLLPAFKTLGRFISTKLKGESAGDLSETMAYLKRAERSFELAAPDLGMISPFQIREARLMIERLQEISGGGKGEDAPLLKTCQSVLLLMGRVLTRTAMTEAAQLEVVRSWNESMNLIEERPLGKAKIRTTVEADRQTAPAAPGEPRLSEPRDLVKEYEKFRERRAAARPPMIRPIDEVLLSDPGTSPGGSVRSAESLAYAEGDGVEGDRPRAQNDVETGPAPLIDAPHPPNPNLIPGEASMGPSCTDLPVLPARRRSARKSISKFASDLGCLVSRRSEFKTARLERWSSGSVLKFIAWRSLRLFAALVVLYLLIDLTHYFI